MNRAQRKSAAPSGFTLVELLVVIGIIAVLISILLPVLNKARESANRVYCASNLHQLSMFLQMYSNQNDGAVPVGTWGAWGGGNYYLQLSWPYPSYTTFGLLVASGIISEQRNGDGKIFYCPSQVLHRYDDIENNHPWEFAPTNVGTVRTTYSQRPEFSTAPGGGEPEIFTHRWNYSANRYEAVGRFVPKIPKDIKGDAAIVADLLVGEEHRVSGHKDGVNVLYAHFGAHWVPRDMYREEWDAVQNGPPDRNGLNALFKKLNGL